CMPRLVSVVQVPSTASHFMPVVQSSLAEHSWVQYDAPSDSRHIPDVKMPSPRHFVSRLHALPAGSAALCLTPLEIRTATATTTRPSPYCASFFFIDMLK